MYVRILTNAFVCSLIASALFSCKQQEANRPDDIVIARSVGEPDQLNPINFTNNYARQAIDLMFQYLVSLDPNDLKVIPQLATSLAVTKEITEGPYAGGMSYTYEIRKEAVWDDGKPITATDYITGLKAALLPTVLAGRIRPYLASIRDVQTDPANPRKFTIYTSEKYILGEEAVGSSTPVLPTSVYDPTGVLAKIPMATFTDTAAIRKLAESDAGLIAFAEAFNSPQFSQQTIVGSGAYTLESWTKGQNLVLTRKKEWWADKLKNPPVTLQAYPDKIEYRFIADDATASAALKAEDIDVMATIGAEEFDAMKKDAFMTERYNLNTSDALIQYFLYLNTRNPKLSDKRVRKAIAHVVNVNEAIKAVVNGYGTPVNSPVHPKSPYYNKNLKPVPFSPETATALLSEAGWKDTNGNGIVDKVVNGQSVELVLDYLLTAGRATSEALGLLVQDNAKKAGIQINLVPKEGGALLSDLKSGNYEVVSGGRTLAQTLWDPAQEWMSNSPDNRTFFGSPATDSLIVRVQTEMNVSRRNKIYYELQEKILDEQPVVFLFVPTERIATHKRYKPSLTVVSPGYSIQLIQRNEDF